MRVPVVAGEDRQQQGRQHRARIRRVVAVVGQRAVRHPRIEYAAHLEELDEIEPIKEPIKKDDEPKGTRKKNAESKKSEQPSIRDLLKKGQEIWYFKGQEIIY